MTRNLELRPQTSLPAADSPGVPLDCSGCEWLRTDAGERRRLAAEFSHLGEKRLAEIAEQSVADLVRDWHAHIRRDHPEGAASLLALRAIRSATTVLDRDQVPPFLSHAR